MFIVICYYNVWFAFIFTRHCIQNAVHLCTMSHCIMDGSQTQRDTPDTCVNLRLHKAARMKAALICFDKCLTGHFTKDKHINHCSVRVTHGVHDMYPAVPHAKLCLKLYLYYYFPYKKLTMFLLYTCGNHVFSGLITICVSTGLLQIPFV